MNSPSQPDLHAAPRPFRWSTGSRRCFVLLLALTGVLTQICQAQTDAERLNVTSDMLAGNFMFFASPAISTFADPIPYGFDNNVTDTGWIWVNDSELDVAFPTPTIVSQLRVWCVYAGGGADTGARGADWTIEQSDDNATWTEVTVFHYRTGPGLGRNDDGTFRPDPTGWYGVTFNEGHEAHPFWRIRQTAVTLTHAPRSATLELLGPPVLPYVISTSPRGTAVRSNASIEIQVKDATTRLAPDSVQLFLNNKAVQPTVTKPAGTNVTLIAYAPPAGLPVSTNTVRYIFGNSATPQVLQTNEFSFVVINDEAGALVINVDFNGVRNTETDPQSALPTFVGQGSAGGGTVWNGVLVDSRAPGLANNDSLTVTANNLTNSIGGVTTVGFMVQNVGGSAEGAFTANATDGSALMSDWLFNNTYGNYAGRSEFTISGLGEVPSVNLYFYMANGQVLIPGVSSSPFTEQGIYVWPNTIYPVYFANVPVSQGRITGAFGGGTAMIGGLSIESPSPQPFVRSVSPTGVGVDPKTPVRIELQDYVTQVRPETIRLLLNGQAVVPQLTTSAGLTTLSYAPSAGLPPTSNTVTVIFGDSSTPSLVQTNTYGFVVSPPDLLTVDASMVSGEATFFATAADYTRIRNPVPYGAANNVTDQGWIWNTDSYFVVDFGAPTAINQFRVYCSYVGNPAAGDDGARGADLSIEYSDDNATWTQATIFMFMTGPGLGTNEDGSYRTDAAGWYGTTFNDAGEAHRYWKVLNLGATLKHAPRCAQVEFYGKVFPPPHPIVKSTSPRGPGHRRSAVITAVLQDNVGLVAPASIKLSVNGQTVNPAIDKPAGSDLTTVTYDAQGNLPVGQNHVTLVFGDNSTPPFMQTNQFSFTVMADDWLQVTPDMMGASTIFFATPAGLTVASPIPYGVLNNESDIGWIWVDGSFMFVDFQVPTVVNRFRAYVSFPDSGRGATWAIEYSNDNLSYTHASDFLFESSPSGGANDDGTLREDCAGWYETRFNDAGAAARFWRVRQTAVTVAHAPRVAQVEFYGRASAELKLRFTREANSLVLSWTGTATLEAADVISGPWVEVPGAASPQTIITSSGRKFYRLRQ